MLAKKRNDNKRWKNRRDASLSSANVSRSNKKRRNSESRKKRSRHGSSKKTSEYHTHGIVCVCDVIAKHLSHGRAKLEEKRKRDDERQRRLDEKRSADEEKLRKLEEKRKQQEEAERKQAQAKKMFMGFFKKREGNGTADKADSPSSGTNARFKPYQLKENQTLSPVVPPSAKERFVLGSFDASVRTQDDAVTSLYLSELRQGYKPHKTKREWRRTFAPKKADIIILDEVKGGGDEAKIYKAKFLKFHENYRPAWFGTWRKRSRRVTGRRPFGKDGKMLNYEVDSEEEWEEEEAGESIKGSDSEHSNEEDNYEIDNDIFVPHGYLSGSEGENEEMDVKGTLRESEIIASRNRVKVKSMKPYYIGPIWANNKENEMLPGFRVLKQYRANYNFKIA